MRLHEDLHEEQLKPTYLLLVNMDPKTFHLLPVNAKEIFVTSTWSYILY